MCAEITDKISLQTDDYLRALKLIESAIERNTLVAERSFEKIDKATKKPQETAKKGVPIYKQLFDSIKIGATAAVAVLAGLGVAIGTAVKLASDAAGGIRIRRSFESLAASFDQSGTEIIDAIKSASAGTINEIDAMRQANLALQLGVAKTPAEFEKLTRSAIALGRATGRDANEALETLINAAGRRATEVLDNLGISLAAVNERMDRLARQQFDKPVTQLSQAQRNAIFMQAALDEAAEAASRLGDNIDDVAANAERAQARIADFTQDVGEAFLILESKALDSASAIFGAFFGSDGIFPLFVDSANIVAEVAAAILAAFFATAGGIVRTVNEARSAIEQGDILAAAGLLNPLEAGRRLGENFVKSFNQSFEKIRGDFPDIFDPGAAGAGVTPFIPPTVTDETTGETEDAVEKAQKRLEELERDHQRNLEDIQLDGIRKRRDQIIDNARDRVDLARKQRQRIEDIERDAARDAADTDRDAQRDRLELEKDLADQQVDIQEDTARRIADIINRSSFDLEEAARRRDAVAFLRIQRESEQQIQEAERGAQQQTSDVKVEAERRREELRQQQEFERSDNMLALERKLEDARIAGEREVFEQNLKERRLFEDLHRAQTERLQDAARANEQKLADFKASLDAEVLALLEAETMKTAIVAEAEAQRAAIRKQAGTSGTFRGTGQTDPRRSESRNLALATSGPQFSFQGGGIVPGPPGQPVPIMAHGGEFIFDPRTAMTNPAISSSMVSRTTINNNTASLGGLLDAGHIDAFLAARAENILSGMVARLFGGI